MEFIRKLRKRFEEFEAKGKKLSECEHCMEEVGRVRQRNRCYDEPGSAPELPQTPADKFRRGTFLVLIDSIDGQLQKRLVLHTQTGLKRCPLSALPLWSPSRCIRGLWYIIYNYNRTDKTSVWNTFKRAPKSSCPFKKG